MTEILNLEFEDTKAQADRIKEKLARLFATEVDVQECGGPFRPWFLIRCQVVAATGTTDVMVTTKHGVRVQVEEGEKCAWIYCEEGEVTLAVRALIVGLRG